MENITGQNLGPYQVISPLGEGGMAAVFKAYHPNMDRYVALKVLPRHFSQQPDFLARFSQEARLIANLEHPNILPVYDFGEADEYTYLVMRLVECGSLSDLLHSGKRLSYGQIQRYISQLGDGLGYAHSRGIIHRDIKPANILIDSTNNCLLTDFGVAKMIEATSHLTKPGSLIGTPFYMSPEQGMGRPVDPRSDIYALGVVLYQLITGVLPYNAETPMAVMFKHIHDPLPPPGHLVRDLPENIERIILKALAKDPSERYETAGDLVTSLNSAFQEISQDTIPQQNNITEDAHCTPTAMHDAETIASPVLPGDGKPSEPTKSSHEQAAVKKFSLQLPTALILCALTLTAAAIGYFATQDQQPLSAISQPQKKASHMATSLEPNPSPIPAALPPKEPKSSKPDQETQTGHNQTTEPLDNEHTAVAHNALPAPNPELAEPYCQRGYIFFDDENFSKALEEFTQCRAKSATQAHQELEIEAAAMAALSEARAILVKTGNSDRSLEIIDRGLSNPNAPFWLRCERALLNMDMENYSRALQDFDTCARAKNLDGEWSQQIEKGSEEARGNIAVEQGELKRGLQHFQNWATLAPKDAEPHCYIGDIHSDLEQYELGQQAFEQCAQLATDPGIEQWANYSLAVTGGLLAKQQGDPAQAIVLLSNALTLNPQEIWLFCELGELHTAKAQHAEAKQYFQECLTRAGDDQDLMEWAKDMLNNPQ